MWIKQTELHRVRWNSLCRNLMASLANGNLWMRPPPCKFCRNDLLSCENKAIMFWKQKWCFQEITGKGFGSHKQWNSCLTCLYGCQSSVWSSAVFRVDGLWQTLLLKPLRHTWRPQTRGRGWGRNGSRTTMLYEIILASDLYVGCFEIWLSILMQCLQINLYVVIICFLMIKHFDSLNLWTLPVFSLIEIIFALI